MRPIPLIFLPFMLPAFALVAQQGEQPSASAPVQVQAVSPAANPAPNQQHAPASDAKARKAQEKEDAKTRREEEKARKEAEKDATFLKLQNNEIVATTFDENGNPIKLPPCARKDKECQAKRKEFLKQKKAVFRVENGTLTVDGWTGKARLNYDVKNFQFLYVSVPAYGTIVASPERFPDSTELPNALNGKSLTIVTTDRHTIEIASDSLIAGKAKRSMYYRLDAGFTRPGTFPTVGYGFVNKQPYSWPGTLPPTAKQKELIAKAPPLPHDMEMREMVVACQSVVPGQPPKPVKVNGVFVTPPPCGVDEAIAGPGAFASLQRPPDGSGAASTGVPENHAQQH